MLNRGRATRAYHGNPPGSCAPSRAHSIHAAHSSVDGPTMSVQQETAAPKPRFDNQGQYSRGSILRYEKIFGEHYISTGGAETTENLCNRLGDSLRPGIRVLDVGSG